MTKSKKNNKAIEKSTRFSNKFFILLGKYWLHIIVLIFLIRVSPIIVRPSLWAEDSTLFYGPLIKDPTKFIQLATSPYNGQFWIFDFVIAKIVLILCSNNLAILPLVSTLVSLLLVVLFSSFWLRAENLLPKKWQRQLVFCFLLMAPSSYEPLGNLTNLHSYLLLGSIALPGWRYKREFTQILPFVVFGMFSLVTSINGFFVLIGLLFFVKINKIQLNIILVSAAAVIGFQISYWKSRAISSNSESGFEQIKISIFGVVKRIGAETIVGQNGGYYLQNRVSNGFWLFVGVPFLLASLYFIFRGSKAILNELSLQYMFGIIVIYFGLVWISSKALGISAITNFGVNGRYLMVIHCLIFIFFIQLAPHISESKINSIVIYFISICFTLGVVADFKITEKSTSSTRTSWASFSDCMDQNLKNCKVVVPPGQEWGDWGIIVER